VLHEQCAAVVAAEYSTMMQTGDTLRVRIACRMADMGLAALEKANLLRTDLHERALRALEEYTAAWESTKDQWGRYEERNAPWQRMVAIGRESLALKAPKPRWTVEQQDYQWAVYDTSKAGWSARFGSDTAEADARAYAAQKNAEASK
jgi:hypothetical protein